MDNAHKYMRRCFDLAALAGKNVRSNPKVGAVIVHNEKIIGEGYHQKYGGPHAEVNAVESVPTDKKHLLKESTLYVSLEPCCHHGKTPACTDLIIRHKIPKVIISCNDPNPLVSGEGVAKLRQNGINVESGILEKEGKALIADFRSNIIEKRPFVILKIAKSKDNYIGREGENIWLSNDYSKLLSHKWRSRIDAIMVGTNTALNDNPALTTRNFPGPDPLRIVLDRKGLIPESHHLISDNHSTLIFSEKKRVLKPQKEQILYNFEKNDLSVLLSKLYEREIYTLLVEGGAKLIRSFIDQELWDEARIINTPKMLENGIKASQIGGFIYDKIRLYEDHVVMLHRKKEH